MRVCLPGSTHMLAPVGESLSSIGSLLDVTPSTCSQSSHLLSLLHQRAHSLLQLQTSLSSFSSRREELGHLVASYAEAVEDEIGDEVERRSSARSGAKEAQGRLLKAFVGALNEFEKDWEEQTRAFDSWELRTPPLASTSARDPYAAEFTAPNSWIDHLHDTDSEAAILEFVELLLADPCTLGAGIATLEGDVLTSLLPPHSSSSSPLRSLFHLVAAAKGPEAVLELAVGAWDTAIREIVGRESSRNQAKDGENKGKGKAGGGAREKELEEFLVGMLDLLDSMGTEVGSVASVEPKQNRGTDPLSLHRGVEDVLLQLLYDAQGLRSQTLSASPTSSPPSSARHAPSAFNPANWSSTMTNTFSTLSSYSSTSLSTVATLSSNLSSALPFPNSSPPSLPSSFTRSSPLSSSTPSNPSRLLHTAPLHTPLSSLLTRTSTTLLKLLAPSPSSSTPLLTALISHLLSTSFPASSPPAPGLSTPAAHHKVLLLAVTRWYGFGWLGAKLGKLGTGGGWTTTEIPCGVRISKKEEEREREGGRKAGTALLDEVYVGPAERIEVLLGLHRCIYSGIVGACGLGAAVPDEDRDARALRKAAKAFVGAWSSGAGKVETSEERGMRAFLLDPGTLVDLVASFGQLVLRSPAAAPIHSPTSFKRSSAFNPSRTRSSTTFSSAASTSARSAEDGPASLGERLEVVAGDVSTSATRDAAFVIATYATNDKLKLSLRIPEDELSNSPATPPRPASSTKPRRGSHPTPPSLHRNHSLPVPRSSNGWISPPRSPRQEALQSSMQSSSSYFATRTPSPSTIPPDDLIPELSRTSSLTWRTKKKEKEPSASFSSAEMALVRKGVFALARAGYRGAGVRSTPQDVFAGLEGSTLPSSSQQVLDALAAAAQGAAEERDYPSHVLYSQSLSILRHHHQASGDLDSILIRIAAPLREANVKATSMLRLAERRLAEVDAHRRSLLEIARSERGVIDDLRIRAWYSSVKASEQGRQLRSRLADLRVGRTKEERNEARERVEAWANELGIYSFAKAAELEEALMLVETGVALAMQPETFYANPFWAREQAVVASLVASRHSAAKSRPSFAETLLASGSSILAAPLTLAGLPYPSIENSTTSGPSPPAKVVFSFGAASPSMLKPHEATTAFAGAVEEHLLRVGLKLSGYMWSDVASSAVSSRDVDGRLFGCDSWLEEFASPLSPLARLSPGDVRFGLPTLSKAFLPSTPPPPPYFEKILKRFTTHPSPHAKLHALLELELVLSASMSAPSSAHSMPTPSTATESVDAPRARGYIAKLSGLLSKRMSLAPSPIAMLLEGDEEDVAGLEHAKDPSIISAPDVFASPRRRRQLSNASASTITVEDLHHPLFAISQLDPSTTTGSFANTDDLLISLESILLHVRPSALFQNLQTIASLTPSAILDSNFLGKAFWDVGLAALSVKRDVVEGEAGIVERALGALGEGTEEGRELAERLLGIAAKEESAVALGLVGSLGPSRTS